MEGSERTLPGRTANASSPKIGLALGGGGVRGMAHAGVLSVFDREGISISALAGTSMGAIVGASYALNQCFDKDLFASQILEMAEDLPAKFRARPPGDPSFLNRVRLLLDVERFLMETIWGWGFLPHNHAVEVLGKITMGMDLSEARIPFAVVAVDLNSGEKLVFREGPAARAVQASASIPGFVPPVPDGRRLLADGGVVDVVPADVVRAMGADIVIAVDVDQDRHPADVQNGLQAFLRAIDLSARDHKRCLLQLADLVIDPDFGEPVSTFDISKVDLCIQAGAHAAESALVEVRQLLAARRPGIDASTDIRSRLGGLSDSLLYPDRSSSPGRVRPGE